MPKKTVPEYPYDVWLSKKRITLKRGVDFDEMLHPRSVAQTIRNYLNRKRAEVRKGMSVSIPDNNTLHINFFNIEIRGADSESKFDEDTINWFIGIDPGRSGGIAIVNRSGTSLIAHKMPETEKDVLSVMENHSQNSRAYIERVSAMPTDGVVSSFKFGYSYGSLVMALTACKISFAIIQPTLWQKSVGMRKRKNLRSKEKESKTSWKNRLKQKAQQLYPKTKITLATADAVLIAESCRLEYHSLSGEK